MSWSERVVLLLFAAVLILWGVTSALGNESGFGLVVLFGVLTALVVARRFWKRARSRPVQ